MFNQKRPNHPSSLYHIEQTHYHSAKAVLFSFGIIDWTCLRPQSKHNMSIKNYDNLFEYDSNVLPYSQNFRFVSYRINLHISSCLTKKENGIVNGTHW